MNKKEKEEAIALDSPPRGKRTLLTKKQLTTKQNEKEAKQEIEAYKLGKTTVQKQLR